MSKKILIIETATEVCGAAISIDGKIASFRENENSQAHASLLPVQIQEVLSEAQIDVSQLDAVAVSHGPGSYTTLRVGASLAKGICYAAGIPLISVNTLKALAYASREEMFKNSFPGNSGEIIFVPMIDARRMEVCCASFDSDLNEIVPASQKILSNNLTEKYFCPNLGIEKGFVLVFSGNGSQKAKGVLKFKEAAFFNILKCSVRHLANLALNSFQKHDFQSLAYYEPLYFKNPAITIPGNTHF